MLLAGSYKDKKITIYLDQLGNIISLILWRRAQPSKRFHFGLVRPSRDPSKALCTWATELWLLNARQWLSESPSLLIGYRKDTDLTHICPRHGARDLFQYSSSCDLKKQAYLSLSYKAGMRRSERLVYVVKTIVWWRHNLNPMLAEDIHRCSLLNKMPDSG